MIYYERCIYESVEINRYLGIQLKTDRKQNPHVIASYDQMHYEVDHISNLHFIYLFQKYPIMTYLLVINFVHSTHIYNEHIKILQKTV